MSENSLDRTTLVFSGVWHAVCRRFDLLFTLCVTLDVHTYFLLRWHEDLYICYTSVNFLFCITIVYIQNRDTVSEPHIPLHHMGCLMTWPMSRSLPLAKTSNSPRCQIRRPSRSSKRDTYTTFVVQIIWASYHMICSHKAKTRINVAFEGSIRRKLARVNFSSELPWLSQM